jgi:hypothetical protein
MGVLWIRSIVISGDGYIPFTIEIIRGIYVSCSNCCNGKKQELVPCTFPKGGESVVAVLRNETVGTGICVVLGGGVTVVVSIGVVGRLVVRKGVDT